MKAVEHFAGIYMIYFIGSNKSYIGSSFDICKRGNQHLNALRNNNHKNKKLQRSFNKYGEYSFCFEILEKTILNYKTKEERNTKLRSVEQEYLDTLFCANSNKKYFKKNSLNLSTKATGSVSINSQKGKNNKKSKTILIYDLSMNFIEKIIGLRETERKYKLNGIYKCCKGQCKKVGNYIFRYEDLPNIEYKKKSKKGYKQIKNIIPVFQYSAKTGKFIREWRCAEDAQSELKLSEGAISRVLNKQFNYTNGFIFKYEKVDQVEPVKIIEHYFIQVSDADRNILGTFKNYNQASKFTNTSRTIISDRCKDGKLSKNKFYYSILNQHI